MTGLDLLIITSIMFIFIQECQQASVDDDADDAEDDDGRRVDVGEQNKNPNNNTDAYYE